MKIGIYEIVGGLTNRPANKYTDNFFIGIEKEIVEQSIYSRVRSGNVSSNNDGSVTKLLEKSTGTAVVANGTTSIAVNHGIGRTPVLSDLSVTPTNNLGNATKFWISGVTSTQFTIDVDVNPGATTAAFVWKATIS